MAIKTPEGWREAGLVAVFLLFSLIILIFAPSIAPRARILPILIGSLTLMLTIGRLLTIGFRDRWLVKENEGKPEEKNREIKNIGLLACTLLIIFLLGFLPGTWAYLIGHYFLVSSRKPIPTAVTAGVITVFLYLLFGKVLGVPLLAGVLL